LPPPPPQPQYKNNKINTAINAINFFIIFSSLLYFNSFFLLLYDRPTAPHSIVKKRANNPGKDCVLIGSVTATGHAFSNKGGFIMNANHLGEASPNKGAKCKFFEATIGSDGRICPYHGCGKS
jgi:hypothetical protein